MNILQLPLKEKWFKMTGDLIKTEDYRKITPYFCSRFLLIEGRKKKESWWESYAFEGKTIEDTIGWIRFFTTFVKFDQNKMTWGYPSKSDSSKILDFEHKGIKIDYGKTEWGADQGELYFVVKHGNLIA